MGKDRLDTISKRNHHAAREMETLLWRALTDSPEAAKEYLADDCIMISPLFAGGSDEPMTRSGDGDKDPNIDKALEEAAGERWTGFRIHGDPLVVEIDLMAVALVYKVSLFRSAGRKGGSEEVVATCSSAWRQTAGADWFVCAHHCQFSSEEEEE
ncbi:hypothetical protein QBC39DRAFT_369074 [Podospora conica]|nr:hypothetical protein QBC39DRAFT_369074 [Schizothecium conicum]